MDLKRLIIVGIILLLIAFKANAHHYDPLNLVIDWNDPDQRQEYLSQSSEILRTQIPTYLQSCKFIGGSLENQGIVLMAKCEERLQDRYYGVYIDVVNNCLGIQKTNI